MYFIEDMIIDKNAICVLRKVINFMIVILIKKLKKESAELEWLMAKKYDVDELFEKCIMLQLEYLKFTIKFNIEYIKNWDCGFKRNFT